MYVGLTYDLRSSYLSEGYSEEATAEFDRDDTIFALSSALSGLGHVVDRIGNARALTRRLVAGDRWDLVFNICEGLFGIGREAQVPAILDLYTVPYVFSDPLVLSLTLHKGLTKRVIRDAGLATSPFAVVESDADLGSITFDPPYFVKPVAEGTGKGVTTASIVEDRAKLAPICNALRNRFAQPVLVESFLPGREFTTGLLGSGSEARILATMEIHLGPLADPGVYSFTNKEESESRVTYRRVQADQDAHIHAVECLALAAWRVLGCRDAGRVDIRCDADGQPQFLEVNPLAGLHPEHSDLPILAEMAGISFSFLIEQILASAISRMAASPVLARAGIA